MPGRITSLALTVASTGAADAVNAVVAQTLVAANAGLALDLLGFAQAGAAPGAVYAIAVDHAVAAASLGVACVDAARLYLGGRAESRSVAARRQRRDPFGATRSPAFDRRVRVGAQLGVHTVAGAVAGRAVGEARVAAVERRPEHRDAGAGVLADVAGLALTIASGVAADAVDAVATRALIAAAAQTREVLLGDAGAGGTPVAGGAVLVNETIAAAGRGVASIDATGLRLHAGAGAAAVAKRLQGRELVYAARSPALDERVGVNAPLRHQAATGAVASRAVGHAGCSRAVRHAADGDAGAELSNGVARLALTGTGCIAAHLVDAVTRSATFVGSARLAIGGLTGAGDAAAQITVAQRVIRNLGVRAATVARLAGAGYVTLVES